MPENEGFRLTHRPHVARRAADFGVVISGGVGVDMARVKARKDAIVRRSATGVEVGG